MNLIFGTVAFLSFQRFGVFGDCLVKPSDFDEFMDGCASCFIVAKTLFFRTAGARRYELLLRPEEKDTEVDVKVKVYRGDEPDDASSLAIGGGKSYSATINRDCLMNITVLQPVVSTGNAKVIFSGSSNNSKTETLTAQNVTFLGLEVSTRLSLCSKSYQEDCNGNDVEKTRDETQVVPVNARRDATTEEARSNSKTGKCNNTVTTVLGILLALSLLINKFFVIRIGLRKLCSRRSDEGTITNAVPRSQGFGNFPRANSAHDSENSLYGAVINRK
ncbi:uncharacterized protein [Macrobrachium rosenbergii]|uniref:uncharacterized protein isoform X2 n=1 Tax=Macrobrachium rosenbergii TaxID=79674 RepID=UPI0034D49E99